MGKYYLWAIPRSGVVIVVTDCWQGEVLDPFQPLHTDSVICYPGNPSDIVITKEKGKKEGSQWIQGEEKKETYYYINNVSMIGRSD